MRFSIISGFLMKNNHGFTIIEICIVMLILGIMAAFAIPRYQKAVASSELEKAANNLYQELRATRALAFRYDTLVMVKFSSTSLCSIYVDKDADGTRDAGEGECMKVHKIDPPVSIGVCSTVPSSYLCADYTPNTSGLAGTWKTLLTVDGDDSRGEFSHGAVYLNTSQLPKVTYCIGITEDMQSIKLYKWDGTWHTL
jgi:prepilin-type N-terminal cleavage/methylation domain-containing protein